MIRTIERKALINKQTHINLYKLFNHLTEIYNSALSQRKQEYKNNKKSITLYGQQKQLTQIRKKDKDWRNFSIFAQRTALKRLDEAYKRLFKLKLYKEGKGFPRFKTENSKIRSFENPDPNKIKQKGNKYFFKIRSLGIFSFGKKLPEGEIKLIRVVKTPRRIKLQFIMEVEDSIKQPQDSPIGIDMGVSNLVTLSNGIQIQKKKIKNNLIKLQRKVSKSKRGSNNRKKKRLLKQKEEQRVKEKENGFLHKLTSDLVKQNNTYIIEDLDIQNMTKKKKGKNTLHKNIINSRWGYFKDCLTYKAESAGGKVIKVNPAYTSKRCSNCGVVKEKLTLQERTYKCDCGLILDRDINAAKNILLKGIKNLNLGGIQAGTQEECFIKAAPPLTA